MSCYYDINLDSLIQTLLGYQFLTPALWLEYNNLPCYNRQSYRFLKEYIGVVSFEYACHLYDLEDKGKTLIWAIRRLKKFKL